jgi:predicted dithiol-disulfide oxidoreductase (DUF899 family)
MTDRLKDHKIVSEEEWVKARKALLKKEKEFTTLRDQLSQQRRLIRSMSLRDRMGNKPCQNFLTEEANY